MDEPGPRHDGQARLGVVDKLMLEARLASQGLGRDRRASDMGAAKKKKSPELFFLSIDFLVICMCSRVLIPPSSNILLMRKRKLSDICDECRKQPRGERRESIGLKHIH